MIKYAIVTQIFFIPSLWPFWGRHKFADANNKWKHGHKVAKTLSISFTYSALEQTDEKPEKFILILKIIKLFFKYANKIIYYSEKGEEIIYLQN